MRGHGIVLAIALSLSGCAPTITARADDPTLATHVKIDLLNDREVGDLRIQATAEAGIVTLAGEVRSAAQVDRAVAIARRVPGVRDVRSQLVVRPSTSPS